MIDVAQLVSPGQEIHYVGVTPSRDARNRRPRPDAQGRPPTPAPRRDPRATRPGNLADSLRYTSPIRSARSIC